MMTNRTHINNYFTGYLIGFRLSGNVSVTNKNVSVTYKSVDTYYWSQTKTRFLKNIYLMPSA